ncbi:Uu.00g125790.m01.CDS01 [Anthostomella pinea]|uniref:Uu.00g125790.m01.CDS01 n=1 Tax=Anthostomella pinea TaxID=933095 RepID=A0AAI8VIS6_9PEZI|nr:Uu.00g125790.m01.CDS01 [Anthostomella pinea]
MANLLHIESNILPVGSRWIVLVGLGAALLISFIDQNAVSIILADLGTDLRAGDSISWAGTSALIANTVFQVFYGRISDIFGRRNVLLACMGLMALGDLLCGFATSAPQLYLFRGIAGAGNGGVGALANIIVADTWTLETQRPKYQGILGAFIGLGSVIGPFLAAAIANSWKWQGLFWVISTITFVCGIAVRLTVPESEIRDASGHRPSVKAKLALVDWWGLLSSSLGIILLLIPISSGGEEFAWDSAVSVSTLTLGALLMVLFVVIEWRWAAMPLLPHQFFTNPPVCAIMVQNVFMGAVWYSGLYFIPIYCQGARQWSLMQAAILTTPLLGSQAIVSILSGLYMSHYNSYGGVIWCGYGLWTLGSGLTLLWDDTTTPGVVVATLLVIGTGVGLVFQPTIQALQAHTAKEDRAAVISVRNFTRAMGGAAGLAISTAVFASQIESGVASLPAEARRRVTEEIISVPDLKTFTEDEARTVTGAHIAGSRAVFLMWVVLMAICLALCVFIKDRGLTREVVGESEDTEDKDSSENRSGSTSRNEEVGPVNQLFASQGTGADLGETSRVASSGSYPDSVHGTKKESAGERV